MGNYLWRMPLYKDVRAEDAAEALQEVQDKHGGVIRAPDVVDAARPEESAIHPCFEWNDRKAAEKYREAQAGKLVRNLQVVHVTPATATNNGTTRTLPMYFNISEGKKAAKYVSVNYVMCHEDAQKTVAANALRDLQNYAKRYREVLDAVIVSDQISEVVDVFEDYLKEEVND